MPSSLLLQSNYMPVALACGVCRHNELLHRSQDTTPARHVHPLLIYIRLQSRLQLRSALLLCRLSNSAWLNKDLARGHRLASPQGLPHFKHVRHTSGHPVCSIGFCCYMAVHDVKVRRIASFCVTAGFPGLSCAAQALPEPSVAGPAGPDLTLLKPQLQKQWHQAKNQPLGNIQLSCSSDLHVWWTCDQCPYGLPHEWQATVYNRQGMDTQCPFCTNRKLCQHNSLLTVAPSVATYWDIAKNGVTADQVVARSHTRSHWLCPTCCHSWQASRYSKTRNNNGCPKCSSRVRGYTRQPTLTASNHPVMVEFDHSRNQEAGLDPDTITLGSTKKVHWICSNCPRGQLHMYMAPPSRRIGNKTGCPYCSSKQACICNSLQSLYPALAAEWDTARNNVGPDQILPASEKLAYWKNAFGHSWEQSLHDRTRSPVAKARRATIKAELKN